MLDIFFGYDNVPQGRLDFELRSQKGQRSNRCIFVLDSLLGFILYAIYAMLNRKCHIS